MSCNSGEKYGFMIPCAPAPCKTMRCEQRWPTSPRSSREMFWPPVVAGSSASDFLGATTSKSHSCNTWRKYSYRWPPCVVWMRSASMFHSPPKLIFQCLLFLSCCLMSSSISWTSAIQSSSGAQLVGQVVVVDADALLRGDGRRHPETSAATIFDVVSHGKAVAMSHHILS